MKRFANLIIEKRVVFLILLMIPTLFFLYQIKTKLSVTTVFDDLLPTNHPYTKLHYEIRDRFGGANRIIVMLQVRDKEDGGQYPNIFNYETLKKLQDITNDVYQLSAVDPYKVLSLASRGVKNVKMTAAGMEMSTVMHPYVPEEGWRCQVG